MDPLSFTELLVELKLCGEMELLHFLKERYSGILYPESLVAEFLHELSVSSPVCAWLPPDPELTTLVDEIVKGEEIRNDAVKMARLQNLSPVLFRLLDLPHGLVSLLPHLLKVSTNTFCLEPPPHIGPAEEISSYSLSYFPKLPPVRQRGIYTADASRSVSVCNKTPGRHPTLLPGTFTLFCEHGICYGFEVMRNCESPNVAFTILRERFDVAPQAVIYDNACNLHNYCLNCDPLFFKNTKFLVDRFHWDNHRTCSSGYNVSHYPVFARLNSQLVEQANSELDKIKGSLSYMNKKNFLTHLKLFLYFLNDR
jgi:hypothetical protein